MFSRSSKLIVGMLTVLLFLALTISYSFAAEARCTTLKVSGKGVKLTDVIQGDLRDTLVIQTLNNIQNPYELKDGLKLIIPEPEFTKKVKDLPYADLLKEVQSYRERVPAKILKEVAESINGPEKLEEINAKKDQELKHGAASSNMKQVVGQQPVEIERIEFPRRLKHN